LHKLDVKCPRDAVVQSMARLGRIAGVNEITRILTETFTLIMTSPGLTLMRNS